MRSNRMTAHGRRLSLLAVATCMILAGCGWFGGGDAPVGKARPGADRQIAPTGTLPAAHPAVQAAPAAVAPLDETRAATPAIGSIVAPTGGQKVQKEAEEKAAIERDVKERERRAERDAAIRAAESRQPVPGDAAPAPPPAEVPAASGSTQDAPRP